MEQIIFGNIRVQLLSENIVRIEYGKSGKFCDENTFFIPDKAKYSGCVAFTREGNVICFGDYELYIPESAKSLSGVRLEKNGKKIYTYKKLANSGELPPLDKTPEVFAISDTPRIIVPEGGYSAERKGEYKVEENVQDIYLLLCKKDAKLLRKLYVELTGKPELVRLSTLGGWNSKYYAYSEEEAKQLILDYEKHNVPLDVMVIDTDWRFCENGWGYDINEKLFPDMKRFLDFAHSHGVEVMFNDHPEPVNGAQVFAPEEIAYREKNLQSLMEKGLDIWWYDRNWGTHLLSVSEKIRFETLGLYLYEDITRHYYQKAGGNNEAYRRPVIMGNAVNIVNGAYSGIADSASHRYSIQWTGDVLCGLDSLANEIETLIKCGNNCIPYINSDCGGHIGNPDKEQFIRWMQFGTLSPVFRPHCTNTVTRTREPWVFDGQTLEIVRQFAKLRYRLLPVIYKNAYESYETGLPVFKALGWEYPQDKGAAKVEGEYMLGNDILIKPLTDEETEIYLPKGDRWLDVFGGKVYSGGKIKSREYGLNEMPLFVRMGTLLPLAYDANNTKKQTWDRLIYDFYPSKDAWDCGYIYEDDGETIAYKKGQFRKSEYEAYYCEKCNAFVIKLHAAKGVFVGERVRNMREITLKYHLLKGADNVKRVTLNGEERAFKKHGKDTSAFPLNAGKTAPDGGVINVPVEINVNKDYEIRFYL